MNNILLITKREYLTQVKKKSFILLTILTPLFIVGFGVLISLMFKANETTYHFDVVDKSGLFQERLNSTKDIQFSFISEKNEHSQKSNLKNSETKDGLLIIPKLENNDFDQLEKNTKLLINKKIGFDTKTKVGNEMEKIVREEKIKNLGINDSQIKDLDKNFSIDTENIVDHNKSDSDLTFGVKSGVSMISVYTIFMFIIIYGVRVMRSVLEEKNNRVVEVIISSVKPFELMMGKILGVTLVALTQFVVWIGMTLTFALVFNTGFMAMQKNVPSVEETPMKDLDIQQMITEVSHSVLELNFPLIIIVFIVFFLLGYVFYSSIYAAIGSAVDNETETQQFTLFAIIPLTVGMYGSFTVLNNPDGPLAFWLSMIPFTSPVAMVARIPFGVPIWEILVSVLLLLGTTLFMIFVAAKVYRIGILMYGNKVTFKELWKWIRA